MFDLKTLENPKGKVELIETIGKGNFGFVYRGQMIATKQIAAIKVVALKEDELKEILLEVEILRDCKHLNIVNYLISYIRNDDLWICMEFCGGGAVDSLYKNLPRNLTEDEIGVFMNESLKGLAYLHDLKIIHRDIKSGNLLLTEAGEVKLADFGVSAQLVESRKFRANTFIGTPYWMAPEVILAENSATKTYDCKADVWSIGITSIELGDKNPPMSDIHPMRALYLIPDADPKVLMLQNPKKWSKTFVDFIQCCLVKDPNARQSSKEILNHAFFSKLNDAEKSKQIVRNLIAAVKQAKQKDSGGKKAGKTEEAQDSDDEEEFFEDVKKVPDAVPKESAPEAPINKESVEKQSTKESTGSLGKEKKSLTSAFMGLFRKKTEDVVDVDISGIQDDLLDISDKFQFQSNIEAVLKRKDATGYAIESSSKLVFDLVPVDVRLHGEIYGSDVVSLDSINSNGETLIFTFLLIGTDKGLVVADITNHQNNKPKDPYVYQDGGSRIRPLLRNTQFKNISVVEDYGVVVAIAGKTNQIRQYNLESIRNLIRFVYGLASPEEKNKETNELGETLHEEKKGDPRFWATDFIKILNTKDSLGLSITRTKSTIYMGVMSKNDVTVFEWAKLPYLRFMKVKQFWLPESAKFFELFHDGDRASELMVIYEREANLIDFESSQVREIEVINEFEKTQAKEVTKDKHQFRWQSWIQLPNAKHVETADTGAAKSWYHTIKSMKPQKPGAKENVPNEFFSTFAAQSLLTTHAGKPIPAARQDLDNNIRWDDVSGIPPSAPQRVLIHPSKYVIGVTKSSIQIRDAINGKCLQVLQAENPIKVLIPSTGNDLCYRRQGRICVATFNKKKNVSQLYWLRENRFSFYKMEAFFKKQDLLQKASKVIGTGLIVGQKKAQ